MLEKEENIGNALALYYPRYKETEIKVSKPDDFSISSPEGGYNRKYILRLGCGDTYINKYYSEPLYNAVRCLERY